MTARQRKLAIAALFIASASLMALGRDALPVQGLVASYYGSELAGNPTASGEPYNPNGLTAAHKTLPLGTRLMVCKDSCTSVRVNDRGPHVPGRDLDLSEGAAEQIGLLDDGVAVVSVEQTSEKPITVLPNTGGPK